MDFVYTSKEKVHKPGYVVHIEYEHGDADATTFGKVFIKSEAELKHFIEVFKELEEQLEIFLSNGEEVSDEFKERAESERIPLESDIVYNGMTAYMNIKEIIFINDNLEDFKIDF